MGKKDIILTAGLLLIAAVIYILLQVSGHGEGNRVVVKIGGEEYGIYRLDENQEFEIKSENGYNKIAILNGKVYMEDADCPDRYCVHQGKISKSGESVICLPHKLSVEIKEIDEERDLDAIAK